MAVIVAALFDCCDDITGAGGESRGGRKPKVKVSLVGDNQTFEAGETKHLHYK